MTRSVLQLSAAVIRWGEVLAAVVACVCVVPFLQLSADAETLFLAR